MRCHHAHPPALLPYRPKKLQEVQSGLARLPKRGQMQASIRYIRTFIRNRPSGYWRRQVRSSIDARGPFTERDNTEDVVPHLIHFQGNSHHAGSNCRNISSETRLTSQCLMGPLTQYPRRRLCARAYLRRAPSRNISEYLPQGQTLRRRLRALQYQL